MNDCFTKSLHFNETKTFGFDIFSTNCAYFPIVFELVACFFPGYFTKEPWRIEVVLSGLLKRVWQLWAYILLRLHY